MTGLYFVIAVIFCFLGLGWLLLVSSALLKQWSKEPSFRYVLLWRLFPPVQLLSLFIPQLFLPELGFRSPWFLFGYLTFIIIVALPYLIGSWRERKKERKLQAHRNEFKLAGPEAVGEVKVQLARPQDYADAGAIFAEVFGNTLDQTFGHDRTKNGKLLGDLLRLRPDELFVALDEQEQVVGAMWLDQGKLPKLQFNQLFPILKSYLDQFNATYGALIGIPSMMARRGSKKRAYIQWLGVAPASQSHHIGTQLLEVAQQLACRDGHAILALHTETENHRAREFYHRFGMKEMPRLPLWLRVYLVKKLDR